jgi:hypothetical protein
MAEDKKGRKDRERLMVLWNRICEVMAMILIPQGSPAIPTEETFELLGKALKLMGQATITLRIKPELRVIN